MAVHQALSGLGDYLHFFPLLTANSAVVDLAQVFGHQEMAILLMEYVRKRVRLFWTELSLASVAYLGIKQMAWQLRMALRILK